ncbi:MAG: hypothetical protein H7276_19820 [Caulobacter sp.]|nr:hypothetical protein [Vitreoscilla sp.]
MNDLQASWQSTWHALGLAPPPARSPRRRSSRATKPPGRANLASAISGLA